MNRKEVLSCVTDSSQRRKFSRLFAKEYIDTTSEMQDTVLVEIVLMVRSRPSIRTPLAELDNYEPL